MNTTDTKPTTPCSGVGSGDLCGVLTRAIAPCKSAGPLGSLAVALVRRSGRTHPMKGYRYIKRGEIFQTGDQFRDGPHGWQTMGGHMAGVKNDGLLVRTRRLSLPNVKVSEPGR